MTIHITIIDTILIADLYLIIQSYSVEYYGIVILSSSPNWTAATKVHKWYSI